MVDYREQVHSKVRRDGQQSGKGWIEGCGGLSLGRTGKVRAGLGTTGHGTAGYPEMMVPDKGAALQALLSGERWRRAATELGRQIGEATGRGAGPVKCSSWPPVWWEIRIRMA